jgi:hypothetical protein
MGVFNPYLTVIEKGMRESNHAINFIFYMATSKRFRKDFQRICGRPISRIFGSAILFLCKHICFCWRAPACLSRLERNISGTTELDSTFDAPGRRPTYYTSRYQSNFERQRQNQLLKATLLSNNTTITGAGLSPASSFNVLPACTGKTVRTLTWNPYDPMARQMENRRQAARLSRHRRTSGDV